MDQPVYEEKQAFAWWTYATLLPAAILSAGGALLACRTTLGLGVAALTLLALAAIASLLFLRILVFPDRVEVHLGLLPLAKKRIPLRDILDTRVVTYRPILHAGGWGWRWGWFEQKRCTFLNARGNQGVWLHTHKENIILGSQTPDRLCAAIEGERRNG